MLTYKRYLFVWLLGGFLFCWTAHIITSNYIDRNDCSMSYGRFVHVPVPFDSMTSKATRNYGSYLFREGGSSPHFSDPDEDAAHLGGTPVLFIPGNAGSYSQGRSMASLAANYPEFDWFLADFDEDLSAMHGKTMIDESRYINDAIDFILNLYHKKLDQLHAIGDDDATDFVPPESVIIVGHSMGGIVARTLVTLDNYREGSVNTMITLSTPHAYPPSTFDRDTTQLYDLIGQWWREGGSKDISLVSISGGHSDLMVLPDMTSINSSKGIGVQSYEIPGVGLGIDHLAVVWCAELREAVINAINHVADHYSPQRTRPYPERMKELYRRFKMPISAQLTGTLNESLLSSFQVSRSLLYGGSATYHIDGPSHFALPAKSSSVSYKISVDKPVKSAQRVLGGNEYRYYGEKDPGSTTSLMWYASGPFIPQPDNRSPTSLAMVEPLSTSSEAKTKIVIAVDWRLTIANILLHYRTSAACWPFALAVITTMSKIANNSRPGMSFGKTLVVSVTGKWFWWLASGFSLLHLASISPAFRTFARVLQFPSESHNVASLKSVGFSVHDLFLGLYDPNSFWIAPILLAIACCAVSLVCIASIIIVKLRLFVTSKFAGTKQTGESTSVKTNGISESSSGSDSQKISESDSKRNRRHKSAVATIAVERRRFASMSRILSLLPVLYVVPYQCTTIFLALVHLSSIRDCTNFDFAFSQLLIWTSVVDAPVIVVWLKNLNLQWIWAFASLRNIGSALPLVLYVSRGSGRLLDLNASLSRNLTSLVLGYIASYAVLYAGLHAFMLHHLVNYLAFWLLIVGLETE